MTENLLAMRDGRKLEVREYGDPAGHPAFFFHGLIGSHHQASYISEQAGSIGLRIIAPNRPGVGRSDFVDRNSALESVADVEDVAKALQLDEFSLIGISGGTPYALAALSRLAHRVRTVTLISGMGPMQLPVRCTAWTADDASHSRSARDSPHVATARLPESLERFRADPRDCSIG